MASLDFSVFGDKPKQGGLDFSVFDTKPKAAPKSSVGNIGRGLQGAFMQGATSGMFMVPVAKVFEALDVGGYNKKIRQQYPGKTEQWYKDATDKLYNEAIRSVRDKADYQVQQNPYPGQTVGNFAAGAIGSVDPLSLLGPGASLAKGALTQGTKIAAKEAGKYVAKRAAIEGGLNAASDLVSQGMDVATGLSKDIDAERLGTSVALGAGLGGGLGAVHVGIATPKFQQAVQGSNAPKFVKDAFYDPSQVDARTPEAKPFVSQVGEQAPSMSPENIARHREVLASGTREDINKFYDEVGGPKPSDEALTQWMDSRVNLPEGSKPKMDLVQREIHKTTIKDHMEDLTKSWENRPGVNFADDVHQLPEAVRQSAIKDGITPDNTVGFFSHVDNQVHVFPQNLKTPEQASALLFHEGLGHYGLANQFGQRLDGLLKTLYDRNVGQFKRDTDRYLSKNPGAYKGPDKVQRASEEVLAQMSEQGPLKKSLADALESSFRQFGRKMGMNVKYNDAEIRNILAMAHSAVVNGNGRNVVKNRFRQSFTPTQDNRTMYAGERANNAPTDQAQWFTGPDNMRRFEINDNEAQWDNRHSFNDTEKGVDLDEVLIHPQLFKSYPDLRRVRVVRDLGDFGDSRLIQGFLDPHEGKLHISPTAWDPKSTALHEIQHWIQYKEGFSLGGNSDMFRLDNKKNLKTLLTYYKNELDHLATTGLPRDRNFIGVKDIEESIRDRISRVNDLLESSDDLKLLYKYLDDAEGKLKLTQERVDDLSSKLDKQDSPELTEQLSRAVSQQQALIKQTAKAIEGLTKIKGRYSDLTYDMYNLLTGEVEARDVQARMNMTPADRQATKPFSNEGLSPDEMISITDPNQLNMSVDPLGRETVPSDLLDEVDRLKANPRFWSDPEYRANVIEYARSKTTPEQGVTTSSLPDPSTFRTEEEYRASRTMTREEMEERLGGERYLKDLEQSYNDFYKDYVPDPRSDAEVLRAAKDMGYSVSKVKGQKKVQDLSARVVQAQMAADVYTDKIRSLTEKLDTPNWSLGDQNKLRQSVIDQVYILGRLYENTEEAGRALRLARRGYSKATYEELKEMLATDGGPMAALADDETLNKFAKQLLAVNGNKQNPAGANALVRSLQKPNWEEYILTFRQNMMLSGLSTHVTAVRDMLTGISHSLMDDTVGLIGSPVTNSLRAIGLIKDNSQRLNPAIVVAKYNGLLRAALDSQTYINAGKTLKEGSSQHTTGGRQYARIPIVSKVGDLIAAEDQFFRAFATNMHLYSKATEEVLEEARKAGKKLSMGDALDLGAERARNPSKGLLKDAQESAEETLLLSPNILTEPLDRFRSRKVLGPNPTKEQLAGDAALRVISFAVNWLLPFVRTATNSLYHRQLRRTPLTFFDPRTISELRNGGVEADRAVGRIILGLGTTYLMWEAAKNGLLTDEGPTNPAKKAIKMATGWRPNATVDVNPDGTLRYGINPTLGSSILPWERNNINANMIANVRRGWEEGANEANTLLGLKLGVRSIMKSLSDNFWLSDVSNLMTTLGDDSPLGASKFDIAMAQQATSVIPNVLGQIARANDQTNPLTYNPDQGFQTLVDTAKSKLPGFRDQLPNRMDPLGNPVLGGATLAGQQTPLPQDNRVVGGHHVNQTTDPVVQEIGRLDDLFEESIVTPVKRNFTFAGQKFKLTNEQFSEYQQLTGQIIRENIQEALDSEEWEVWSDEEKAEWIRKMQNKAKAEARQQLFTTEEDTDSNDDQE